MDVQCLVKAGSWSPWYLGWLPPEEGWKWGTSFPQHVREAWSLVPWCLASGGASEAWPHMNVLLSPPCPIPVPCGVSVCICFMCFMLRPGLFPLTPISPPPFLPWLLNCLMHTQHFHYCPNRTCDNSSTGEQHSRSCILLLQNATTRVDYTARFSLETLRAVLTHVLDSGLSPLPTAGASTVSLLTEVHCCSTSVKLSKRGQLGSDKTSSCVMWKKWMWWCMKCNLCSNISETPAGNSPAKALIEMLSSVC